MSHKAYYKAVRLKSRHARRGHERFCVCPEPIQEALRRMRRKFESTLAEMDAEGKIPPQQPRMLRQVLDHVHEVKRELKENAR